jgi:hypothetical protein
MSKRMQVAMTAVLALAFAGGVYFWLHGHRAPAPMATVGASPSAQPVPSAPVETAPAATLAGGNTPAETAKKPATVPDAGLVLRSGEVLEYTANVSKLNNVANLRVLVAERRNFSGKTAWHLQAFAHTENPLRMVFELDDQFDSYSEAGTMASLQYEMHLSERGQKVESVQRMSPSGQDPAPPHATAARVLPGTRDPLGMMQYLRNVDWTKTTEVRSPVYDGRKLYDVRASIQGKSQAISVPAGNYTASKIEIRVFDNGAEVKDSHFTLYLADNAAHTPVLLEAVLPFATARVELLTAK